ncbi:MAG: patatin-like phospholipase family protein [Dehalococcoidia bacterium]
MHPSTAADVSRTRLALALGAGGTRGWAHAGVLEVLAAASVPIDLIVGASAGALIGALYAAWPDPAFVRRLALGLTPTDFLEWFLNDLRISASAGRMGRRLWNACGRLDFDELKIPLAVTALDLASGRQAVIRSGNVARAVEASIRPPVVTRPVRVSGLDLVDGGLRDPVPVAVARKLGATLVIAVPVGELIVLPRPLRPLSARLGAAYRARSSRPGDLWSQVAFMSELLTRDRSARARADVTIRPDLRGVSGMWPWHIQRAYRRGRAAARAALPEIERLLAARAA